MVCWVVKVVSIVLQGSVWTHHCSSDKLQRFFYILENMLIGDADDSTLLSDVPSMQALEEVEGDED